MTYGCATPSRDKCGAVLTHRTRTCLGPMARSVLPACTLLRRDAMPCSARSRAPWHRRRHHGLLAYESTSTRRDASAPASRLGNGSSVKVDCLGREGNDRSFSPKTHGWTGIVIPWRVAGGRWDRSDARRHSTRLCCEVPVRVGHWKQEGGGGGGGGVDAALSDRRTLASTGGGLASATANGPAWQRGSRRLVRPRDEGSKMARHTMTRRMRVMRVQDCKFHYRRT